MSLLEWGWTAAYDDEELEPARVIAVHREAYVVQTDAGEALTEVSGRLLHTVESSLDLPATGDWMLLRSGIIDRVLPRRTLLSRKAAGVNCAEQVLAANIDVVFIVCGLDGDFNIRRLERFLVIAHQSRATPVIVLNKADLEATGAALDQVREVAAGHDVLMVSASMGWGIDSILDRIPPGKTGVLLGSSGAGKSTIINRLLGMDAQAVTEVRIDDSRGRHTTTHRQLFRIPGGGMLIDQPGLREIQLWASDDSLLGAFPDVAELSSACRFRDCRHTGEPGCAVREALESGTVGEDRVKSFEKLRREIQRVAEETDVLARLKRKSRDRSGSKAARQIYKGREKR